tara:strand:+ start:9900 stop:10577 length:678 start_codon:yes stop_codon:yes gene_type:complete
MKIFLDCVFYSEVSKTLDSGLIDGIRADFTLFQPIDSVYKLYSKLLGHGVKEIIMPVMGNKDEMLNEGLKLVQEYGSAQTIVSVPMTKDGLLVCRELSKQRIRTDVSLVFTIPQAVLAAKAGATYISPSIKHLDEQQVAGLEVIRGITNFFCHKNVATKVNATGIQTVQRAVRSFYNGAEIVSLPHLIFEEMYSNMLTDENYTKMKSCYTRYVDAYTEFTSQTDN